MNATTKKPNTGKAATPEAEAARRQKISTALKAKSAKPKPLNQVAAAKKDEAFAALHILPPCISNVSELAGNPKALELAGKLAETEKRLKASRDAEGVLQRTLDESRKATQEREALLNQFLRWCGASITGLPNIPTFGQAMDGIKGLDRTRSAQLERINSLNASETRLTNQVERLKTEATTLEQRIAAANERVTQLASEKSVLQDKLSTAQLSLGLTVEEKREALKECEALAADLSRQIEEKDAARNVAHTLERQVADLEREVADLQPRLQTWAVGLFALVAVAIAALIAHRMGFDAHAQLIGGAR